MQVYGEKSRIASRKLTSLRVNNFFTSFGGTLISKPPAAGLSNCPRELFTQLRIEMDPMSWILVGMGVVCCFYFYKDDAIGGDGFW